jgi:hypothetical protein
VISVPPSASRMFIILAGAESEASWGSTSRAGRLATSSSSFWWWKPSSSSAEEASSSHAGEGELLLPSYDATFRPLPRFRGEDGSEDLPVRFGAAHSFALRNLLFCHSQFWLSVIMPSRVYDWWDRLCL